MLKPSLVPFLGPADAGNLRGASTRGAAATAEGEGGQGAPRTDEVNATDE